MARTTVNRSVSFDPELFEQMEERRKALKLTRSDYIKKCMMGDLAKADAPMTLMPTKTSKKK